MERPAGYWELVRTNTRFRRLWIGDVVSLLGDWFNTIAVYALVAELTGSPFALGAVFVVKMLPLGLASPIAGVLVDRLDRRRTMIAADLARALVVLGLLVVDTADEIPLLYLLVALQTVIGSVFLPARSASLPNVTSERELLTANALGSATWSVMLALGAALGGVATEYLGYRGVFLLDAATYLVSAWFIARITIPQSTDPPDPGPVIRVACRRIGSGWAEMRRRPAIGRIALAKATWAIGGGGLVYTLALLGEWILPSAPATGIGLLFAVRGLGTGIGPVLARWLVPETNRWVRLMGWCILASGLAYLVAAGLPFTLVLVIPVLFAHTTSGANWVMATVLLQQRTEDRLRGRVFATEWLLIMVADAVSITAASLLLESGLLGLRATIALFAVVQVVSGLVWIVWAPADQTTEGRLPS